ncbi:MAG TPA: T9SS type A sorting domain-containing protein [Chitinophagaceae bacterium]|nr:T9SS type A sorting domain-containing protein [Chitinophagaceae bacterium]
MMRNLRSWLLLLLLCPLLQGVAQVTIKAGSSLTVQPGTTLLLGQEATIDYGGTLINSGTLYFKGNFFNDGALIYAPNSQFGANGNVLQTIASTNPLSFPHFTINNPLGVQLLSPLTITDTLVLVNGILKSDAINPIHFADTAANPIETKSSHIVGRSIMDARTVGTNALQNFLGVSLTAGSDAGDITITRNTGTAAITTIDSQPSIAANWNIKSTITDITGRNLGLSWLSGFDNSRYTPAMRLYSRETVYTDISNGSMDVSHSDPRQFLHNNLGKLNRDFTLLDTGFKMKFILFTGDQVSGGVQLKWLTGTEFNNKGFDIERSVDGINFIKIGFTDGKNGSVSNTYDYLDAGLNGSAAHVAYYRLKQISNDGTEQFSETVQVVLSGIFYFNVYPNPFNDHITIDVVKKDDEPLQVRLISVSGVVMFRNTYPVKTSGRIELKGLNHLPPGTYFLNIANDKFYETIKLIKYHK